MYKNIIPLQRIKDKRTPRTDGSIRPVTLSVKEMGSVSHLYPHAGQRPRTRADCEDAVRPCPYVGCYYHLYLDVNPDTGSIKLNFPDEEVNALSETCALDVADGHRLTLLEIGKLMNMTRERVRQIEAAAIRKLKRQIERE
jgi:hypothetical protein